MISSIISLNLKSFRILNNLSENIRWELIKVSEAKAEDKFKVNKNSDWGSDKEKEAEVPTETKDMRYQLL
jgi:hypothetical protein